MSGCVGKGRTPRAMSRQLDRQMIDAIRVMLDMEPLYEACPRPSEAERFGAYFMPLEDFMGSRGRAPKRPVSDRLCYRR